MFLADAVANYVKSLTERELDPPLIALLRSQGFTHVHLVHGPYEFGKDVIARRTDEDVEHQYCLQSKAGNLNVRSWRELRLQVDAMRTGTVAHPDFDASLPRRLIVVTNGRLIGGAAVEFQDYNTHHRSRDETTAELWDIDDLAPMFYGVLIDGVSTQDRSRTLELLGQLAKGRGTVRMVREYARPWFDRDLAPRDAWANVLTAAMLMEEALRSGREDLAAQLAYLLVRSTWEVADVADAEAKRRIAHALVARCSQYVWEQVQAMSPQDVVRATIRSSPAFAAFTTHPVKVGRLCEMLSMGGLQAFLTRPPEDGAAGSGDFDVALVADWVASLCEATPAVSHPVGDDYAFSLLATCLFLHATGHDVEPLLRKAAIWLLDRVEFADGIAEAGTDPVELIRVLLGAPYKGLRKAGRRDSYALTVVLDLMRTFELRELFAQLVHDVDAVDAYASVVRGYPPASATLIARLSYADDPTKGGLVAAHYADTVDVMATAASGSWFDVLATWATLRDRHTPAILNQVVTHISDEA